MTMKKTVLTLAAGLAASTLANAALTDATTPWGPNTTDAAELAFVEFIGNTQDTGYAHPGLAIRSADEIGYGTVGLITTDLADGGGDPFFINLIYAGGSTNHLREFGFDITIDGMTAEVLLTDPLQGKTAPNIPTSPDANLGAVFSMSIADIVSLVDGDDDILTDADGKVDIDFFVRKKASGGTAGLDDVKVSASHGVAVFDYSPFVDTSVVDPYIDDGVTPGTLGDGITPSPISPYGPGFPEGITRVWGWEDQIVDSADPAGYELGGVDADFNDFIMTLAISATPITNEVPEPSTYGLIGAAALAGLIIRRRMKAPKAA